MKNKFFVKYSALAAIPPKPKRVAITAIMKNAPINVPQKT